jgi:glycosyltransferase involved in cell wall biosynthesis
MRIAHVTATFPPYYSGTGLVCYHNALELARRGHDVTVLTAAHPPGTYEYPPEIRVQRLPVAFRIGNAPLLPGLLWLRGYDIIHLHYPFIFGAEMIWMLAQRTGIPYIITHHNDLIGDGIRKHLFAAYAAVSARLVMSKASKFGVVSLSHAEACRLTPIFRACWDDVVEIPNGVDTNLFHPTADSHQVYQEYGIAEDTFVLLFVGALDRAHHFKGVPYLLQAFAKLQLDDANMMLLVVGDGDLKEYFASLAGDLNISAKTVFPGSRQHNDLPAFYAASDIAVLPSLPPESFGMVLIEAMACGKPVIASNLPGVRSVVNDGEDGLLVEPGNVADLAAKIQQLLDDPQRRQEMGKRGRAKVERQYSWDAIGAKLEQIYHNVVSSHK